MTEPRSVWDLPALPGSTFTLKSSFVVINKTVYTLMTEAEKPCLEIHWPVMQTVANAYQPNQIEHPLFTLTRTKTPRRPDYQMRLADNTLVATFYPILKLGWSFEELDILDANSLPLATLRHQKGFFNHLQGHCVIETNDHSQTVVQNGWTLDHTVLSSAGINPYISLTALVIRADAKQTFEGGVVY